MVLSLVAVVALLQVNAQETKLTVKMAKGDKYSMTSKSSVTSVSEFGGNEMKATVESSTGQDIEVVNFADGKYTLSVTNKGNEVKANSPMGGDMELNTTTGAGFDQFPGGMPKFLKESAGLKYELVINEAGALVSVKGLEKLAKPKEAEEGMIKMMLGGIALNATDSAIIKATLSVFAFCNKGSVKGGESWVINSGTPKTPTTQSFTATAATPETLTIATKGTRKINNTMSMMGQDAEVTGDEAQTGTTEVAVKTGLISSAIINTSTKMTINMGGNEIPSTNTNKTTVAVVKM